MQENAQNQILLKFNFSFALHWKKSMSFADHHLLNSTLFFATQEINTSSLGIRLSMNNWSCSIWQSLNRNYKVEKYLVVNKKIG